LNAQADDSSEGQLKQITNIEYDGASCPEHRADDGWFDGTDPKTLGHLANGKLTNDRI
jgi:hypothetical protein